jgi:hypothetical protein
MPRTLSTTAAQAIFAQNTSEIFLMLLTIAHSDLAMPLRFVNDWHDITRGGQTYLGCAFTIGLPSEREDQPPTVQLRIDNVDRRILEGIRSLTSPPTITLEVVLASSPETLEAGPFALTLRNVTYDALNITGMLTYEDVLNEPSMQFHITPNLFPGAF